MMILLSCFLMCIISKKFLLFLFLAFAEYHYVKNELLQSNMWIIYVCVFSWVALC